MSDSKDIQYLGKLYDIYYPLLTKLQQEYFTFYYFEDLSLKEISEEFAVSRNAIFNTINKTTKILYDYEDKLKLHTKNELIINKIKEENNEELLKNISDIIYLEMP